MPVAYRLGELLENPLKFSNDCIGEEARRKVDSLKEGEIVLLENLRFHPGEESNSSPFAKELASLGDIFVNDAFGTAHRSHASTVGIAAHLPSVSGFLIEKELEVMDKALNDPARPFGVIVGGAKVSDKMDLLENLLDKVNTLLIAGGMGATFLKTLKYNMGDSLVEDDKMGLAQELMDKAAAKGVHLLLPTDVVIANKFEANAKSRIVSISEVPDGWRVMDIGPKTIELYEAKLRKCKTVIWNGPVGVFEFEKFKKGTSSLAGVVASLDATTIIGGGSTAEAIDQMGLGHKVTHVSTGGGASLRLMEGKPLPAVAALMDR